MPEKLDDDSLMPFGKFRGKIMAEVDASYLHWLWSQPGNKQKKGDPVIDYIRENLSALKQEYEDGIW